METDSSRRKVALAYGANTLGAVAGVMISTFYLLEHFGNRMTLWLACGLNLLVSLVALAAFLASHAIVSPRTEQIPKDEGAQAPVAIVLSASHCRFCFLSHGIGLVPDGWRRFSGIEHFPFGLILALALLGIGLGSFAYAFVGWERRPRLSAFALTCALEAFFLAAPFALGDRIAVLALLLRPFSAFGFYGHVLAWCEIGAIVILPAAFFAGLQFPMLIALLGRGREKLVRTPGSFTLSTPSARSRARSLVVLVCFPLLSAIGAWKVSVLILGILVAIVWTTSLIKDRRFFPLTVTVLLTAAAVLMLGLTGPTAAWRQSPIGAGRGEAENVNSPNAKEEWIRNARRYISYQVDGIESCLGISIGTGVSFLINGKSDGNAVYDASTQIMVGLLGAICNRTPGARWSSGSAQAARPGGSAKFLRWSA